LIESSPGKKKGGEDYFLIFPVVEKGGGALSPLAERGKQRHRNGKGDVGGEEGGEGGSTGRKKRKKKEARPQPSPGGKLITPMAWQVEGKAFATVKKRREEGDQT